MKEKTSINLFLITMMLMLTIVGLWLLMEFNKKVIDEIVVKYPSVYNTLIAVDIIILATLLLIIVSAIIVIVINNIINNR